MPALPALLLDVLLMPLTYAIGLWVRRRQAAVLRDGVALSVDQKNLARVLGVQFAERVRVQPVARIPMPLPRWACALAQRLGWLSPHIAGMTLGYGIALREDCFNGSGYDRRLLAHELVHVAQYERLGGIHGFLRPYLRECIWPGYPRGELESEARAGEARGVLRASRMCYRTLPS